MLLSLLAQVVPVPPPDMSALAVAAIVALTPVLSVLVLWGLKIVWAKIPASWMFVASPVVGLLINFALNWIAGNAANFSPVVASILGALAVYLREFLSTLATKGLLSPVTKTPNML